MDVQVQSKMECKCWFCHHGFNRSMQSCRVRLCVCGLGWGVCVNVCVCVCVWTASLIHQVSYRNQEALCVTIPLTVSCHAVSFLHLFLSLRAASRLFLFRQRDGMLTDGTAVAVNDRLEEKDGLVYSFIHSILDPRLNRPVFGELCC